ncbi:hypothetical protein CE91St41_08780 [Oscillospiraceae bacterium]|nr:hypothetical protein CE91St40_08780 [Oscillospiraceae bacterium]BDF73989.1 hypothetical protein CE91St41_08780 [Oscillospiraceae bacterium]
MFAFDGLGTIQYARVDDLGMFELPLLFRAALGLNQHSGVCLALEDGEIRLANPRDRAVVPGTEWAGLDVRGRVRLPLYVQERLNIQDYDYLVLTLDEAARRVCAVPKPEGCITCPETDSSRFTVSDLMCDQCVARLGQALRRGD